MRLAFALLALALVAPSGLAQVALVAPSFGVFVNDPGKAFVPGAVEAVEVIITYGPTNSGRPAPAPSLERPEDTEPTTVTFDVKLKPSWVESVTFDPPVVEVKMGLENQTQTSYTRSTRALLNISPNAPALEREELIIVATASPNGNIEGASSESPPIKLRATTVGKLNVTAEPFVIISGGRWVDVPFTVANQGNSDILAKINVTVRPENSQVEFSDTLELARGESVLVPVRVRTPWTNAEFGVLELEATPIVEGEEGTPARATIDVRGESAVPGASLVWLLGMLGVLTLTRRRER